MVAHLDGRDHLAVADDGDGVDARDDDHAALLADGDIGRLAVQRDL